MTTSPLSLSFVHLCRLKGSLNTNQLAKELCDEQKNTLITPKT